MLAIGFDHVASGHARGTVVIAVAHLSTGAVGSENSVQEAPAVLPAVA
jgi:hypothetical protein